MFLISSKNRDGSLKRKRRKSEAGIVSTGVVEIFELPSIENSLQNFLDKNHKFLNLNYKKYLLVIFCCCFTTVVLRIVNSNHADTFCDSRSYGSFFFKLNVNT